MLRKKSIGVIILILFIFILQVNLIFDNISAARTENISGFHTEDSVQANETVIYHFNNNITFGISTDVSVELKIQYESRIANRQIFFMINNSGPISLNITCKPNMQSFGMPQPPREPQRGNFQIQYRYNCIFLIQANTTIEQIIIRSLKQNQFGFSAGQQYSLGFYQDNQESWQLVDTTEERSEEDSVIYLESTLVNIEAESESFITFFELNEILNNWTWIFAVLIAAIIVVAVVIAISKREYFQYLRTRTISIEKGAHRLSLEEVLENENRNKIIDLILQEPGIHFNELLRKTELAAGNLVWHLDILETYKVIGKKRIGKFIAYFLYYQKNPLSNVDLKLSKSKLTLEVLKMIEDEPGIWNNLITKKLKVNHKTIQYHLDKLIDLDLVRLEKDGRKKKIYPNFEAEYFTPKGKED